MVAPGYEFLILGSENAAIKFNNLKEVSFQNKIAVLKKTSPWSLTIIKIPQT